VSLLVAKVEVCRGRFTAKLLINYLIAPELAPLFTGNEDELSKSFDNHGEVTSAKVKKFSILLTILYL